MEFVVKVYELHNIDFMIAKFHCFVVGHKGTYKKKIWHKFGNFNFSIILNFPVETYLWQGLYLLIDHQT